MKISAAAAMAVMMLPATAQGAGRIRIAAHRGFWDCEATQRTENSIASLKSAQDNGCWGSEFDIHITADDSIVVHHDQHIEGQDIHKNTYSFLRQYKLANGEPMPTLDE